MAKCIICRRGGSGGAFPLFGGALADYTWDEIDAVARAGLADVYWNVGDEKAITLTGGESVTLHIIGFAHDNLVAGGKAPITFCFKNCMTTKRAVNATNTNTGGYDGSALYTTINGTIYNSLPADIRAVMKQVNKNTSIGENSATIETTAEKLFLLSEVEIHGTVTYSKTGEGARYAFFTTGGSKIKNVSGTASNWWHRSPYSDAKSFCALSSTGYVGGYGAGGANGVALGLCV